MYHTPDANITYEVYLEGSRLAGLAQVDLPSLQATTVDVQGPGIGGKISKPIVGMFEAMSMTLNFRTITEDGKALFKPAQHHIECWSGVQVTDPETSRFVTKQHKIIVRGEPKNLSLGKLATAETQDRSLELGIVYYRELYDGVEHIEIDQYNLKFTVDGEDMLADLRTAIGR